MEPEAFIDVRHVFVDVTPPTGILSRLAGRPPAAHSVLRDVSFQLQPGDHVTLYGGEGAGKTVLLQLLAGGREASRGVVHVNGKAPRENDDAAAGFVSSEESEPAKETVYEVLHAFGVTHDVPHLPSRLGELLEAFNLGAQSSQPAARLSRTERLRVNLVRAALSDAPILLLDDVADELGHAVVVDMLAAHFANRTAIVATRHAHTAEHLDLPILLLHNHELAQRGTRDEIATAVAAERILDVWVEGLRYDLLRALKRHPGVASVRLLPTQNFSGQKLRIVLHSSRYLPSLYDAVSQASLVRVEEVPPSLHDILRKL